MRMHTDDKRKVPNTGDKYRTHYAIKNQAPGKRSILARVAPYLWIALQWAVAIGFILYWTADRPVI